MTAVSVPMRGWYAFAVERALRDLGPGAYAEIEAEDPVCEFDCSNRDWTRIKITDGASVYMSEECEFYDEDDY